METFSYVAYDIKTGKEKKGIIKAEDKTTVQQRLKTENCIPISISQQSLLTKDINFKFGKKVTPREMSIFCRQFVSIIAAGVTITEALNMISDQTENKVLAQTLKELNLSIEQGETLSSAMNNHQDIFNKVFIGMVEAGESSGNLEKIFERMAIQFEKEAKLKALVKKTLIYPVILLVVAIAVVAFMMIKVIPSFAETFKELGSELPAITRAVMALSDFIRNFWYVIILVVVALVLSYKMYRKTEKGSEKIERFKLKLPIFGNYILKSNTAEFARILSTLMFSGMPLIMSLDMVSKTMKNILFQNAVQLIKVEVSKGTSLSKGVKDVELFPKLVCHMTGIGEKTGDIENMYDRLAEYYEEEVEITTKSVMAALEPMIIIFMSLIVMVIVAAIMMPIFKMYSGMDQL